MTQTLYPLWKYGRFFFGTAIITVAIPLFILGGQPIKWFAIAVGVAALVTELLSGRYEDEPSYKYPELFYFLQYYSQIAGIVLTILWAWMLAIPEKDLLGIGAAVQALTGYDAIAAHMANDTWGVYTAALLLTGIAGALGSIAIGHELTHRTERPFAVFMGRLGEAFSLFTHFSIRHPYGHHNLVCTPADPATAYRGENFYHFMIRSIIGQKKMTYELEKRRLNRMGKPAWHWENRALRGWGMELLVVLFFAYAAGITGILGILGVGLVTHVGLEAANYIEHYGLIRLPDQPQQIRHAWNSNNSVAYYITVGISRHSHHHADASVEFWNLKAYREEAPTTPYGYVWSFVFAAIPPLWKAVITPKLLEWDWRYATPEEREIAMRQNLKSGIPELMDSARDYFAGRRAESSWGPHAPEGQIRAVSAA